MLMQDEMRDLWRDIIHAKCPKCQKTGLRLVGLESGRRAQDEPPGIATCAYCAGYWAQRGDTEVAVEDPAERFESVPEHDPAADLKAGLCPFGHGILIRARVPLEPGFFLDRCMKCGGIWFDRGEFERLAIASFFEELPLLWNLSYQRETRKREREEREEKWLADNLGEELLASVRAVGKALRGHPFRNTAIALIREESERRSR